MDRRLPPQEGEWIDRQQPVDFHFEGQAYRGFAGDVLSSALWANDVRLLGRSFKYHRPRGLYSLAGHDVNVMVEDGQRTNMRGDLLAIEPGLDVRAVNTSGSLKHDRLRITEWFSKMMPVGFYYKAFFTPRRLFPFYERQMRKVAGLGRINPANRPQASPKDYAFCDLLVVGAGPAGLSAAVAAAEQGLQVLLVDEQPRIGGSLNWQWPNRVREDSKTSNSSVAIDLEVHSRLVELIAKVNERDNIEIRCSTQAAGWYADHWIALLNNERLTKLRAKSVLVATGCFEAPAVFQNNDLPGVMLGSAAQRLIHQYAIKPFDRAVVLAANTDGYHLALDLHTAGVDVAAVVDPRIEGESSEIREAVNEAEITIHAGHKIHEAVGKQRVRAALISKLDGTSQFRIECDGIAVSVGWVPNAGLIYQSGGKMSYSDALQQLVPQEMRAGFFVAGRVNGSFDLSVQVAEGRRSALMAAAHLGQYAGVIPDAPDQQMAAPSHAYPIFAHPGKKNFVDLDEDLHLADFANAHQEGYDNIELMKRYTTVGMGPSQGKLANMNAIRILAKLNDRSINETGSTTSRPFHQPASIGSLAGRRFHPSRRTSLHHWHVEAGAEMIHAGAWFRPEYYRIKGKNRDDCILDEALNVRQNVGLIDVSTLGKLYIQGPDAVRFLEHIYTGKFANQKVGRLRYGLACDEMGVIIEDGIVARLGDDRFYVTATSSGVGAFYREMQRWALIFKMDVTLVNSTGQLSAANLAGPNSRDVLSKLTDIELAPDAFAYLDAKTATVAGVPATLMRVGFVGELGFEIHVPASSAQHVWDSLVAAGEEYNLRPFGVEAQRLLRLEKGHLIVGHDTDALTNPFEANVGWALGKNKEFFIGARSLQVAQEKTLTRLLVGIAFDADHKGPLPEECHLIIAAGEMVGRITSIARRSTLGHAIAMGFMRPDLAEPGTRLQIRVGDGRLVNARVSSLPFYDAENRRQSEVTRD
jgi:sarcosine oxidase subunit alpha